MEYAIVGIILVFLLQIAILKGILELNHEISSGLEELDAKTAQAIASVVEKFGGGGIEPINPVQQALAGLLQSKINEMSDSGSVAAKLRNEQGQFTQQD